MLRHMGMYRKNGLDVGIGVSDLGPYTSSKKIPVPPSRGGSTFEFKCWEGSMTGLSTKTIYKPCRMDGCCYSSFTPVGDRQTKWIQTTTRLMQDVSILLSDDPH